MGEGEVAEIVAAAAAVSRCRRGEGRAGRAGAGGRWTENLEEVVEISDGFLMRWRGVGAAGGGGAGGGVEVPRTKRTRASERGRQADGQTEEGSIYCAVERRYDSTVSLTCQRGDSCIRDLLFEGSICANAGEEGIHPDRRAACLLRRVESAYMYSTMDTLCNVQ